MKRLPCPDLREYREAISKYVLARIVEVPNGCWLWQGAVNSLGYATGCFKGRQWIMTRLLYCATQGDFDPQLDICHTCDTPSCVNPAHLWLGSRSENIKDSVQKKRHFLATATHCKRGHPFSGDNVYVSAEGKRICKICETGRQRVRFGWPEELAFTLPVQQGRFKKTGEAYGRGTRIRRGPKTHCIHGHPLSGDNLYVVPSDGRRQCRTCKLHVIQRIAAERQQSNGN